MSPTRTLTAKVRLSVAGNAGEFCHARPEFKGAVEERAAVTITWRNAKLMRNQLSDLIQAYEEVNGEINIGVKLAAPATSAIQARKGNTDPTLQ